MKEGPLEELIAIEEQTEIILENASPELLASVSALVEGDSTARFVRSGKPKTTLERLFLREVKKDQAS